MRATWQSANNEPRGTIIDNHFEIDVLNGLAAELGGHLTSTGGYSGCRKSGEPDNGLLSWFLGDLKKAQLHKIAIACCGCKPVKACNGIMKGKPFGQEDEKVEAYSVVVTNRVRELTIGNFRLFLAPKSAVTI